TWIVRVKAQITFAVINNHQQTVTAKMICKNYPAMVHCYNRLAGTGADPDNAPLHLPARARTAEAGHDPATVSPGQFTFAFAKAFTTGGQRYLCHGTRNFGQ